jgi:diadenosine tetraphosphate (Ap4A) HIT family hydrolase
VTAIHRRVAACRAGTDQTLVDRLASGWVVMGDPQVITGYCLLLPDPVVPDLNALSPDGQIAFLADMARLGTALRELTGAVRVNYAIFGNLEPALHAHVFPRRASEPEGLRTAHPWAWDWSKAPAFDRDRDGPLLAALRARLSGGPVCGPGPPEDP